MRRPDNTVVGRNLGQHVLNVPNWKLTLGITPNYFEFLADATGRLTPTRRFESLFRTHSAIDIPRERAALNFLVFRIFDYYLQPFAHGIYCMTPGNEGPMCKPWLPEQYLTTLTAAAHSPPRSPADSPYRFLAVALRFPAQILPRSLLRGGR